jgi:tRNA (guanine26-N2/guanine27-N2)-dimethyltransferase
MQINDQTTIIEGKTRMIVLKQSLTDTVPPQDVPFFNPKAKMSRDFSIIAYSAFLRNFDGPRLFLDSMSGVGSRGLRVANEIDNIRVVVNDLNPEALELARKSAQLNGLENFETSENEVCRFLSEFSKKGHRGTIVDIDPFGSPAKYIDCGIRATLHKGLLSITATDQQVLHGLFKDACKKKYHGVPIKTSYSNEIATRLVLGLVNTVAARLDVEITPIFVETNMHYYRVYVRTLNKADTKNRIGYIMHCRACGHRQSVSEKVFECPQCGSKVEHAGPLWIDQLFEKKFAESMMEELSGLQVDKKCEKAISKCIQESEMPPCYYTLDEIAEMRRSSPIPLANVLDRLREEGFSSSPTSFNPTGFRTNATISKVKEIFSV